MKELTPDLYYLFREGMTLRKKHIMEIFGSNDLHLKYPELIWKTPERTYRGSAYLYDILPMPIEYDVKRFIEKAPDIYNNGYKVNSELPAGLLNLLPLVDGKTQVYHGFMSGILKYKSSRFYFDKEGSAILDQYVKEEH